MALSNKLLIQNTITISLSGLMLIVNTLSANDVLESDSETKHKPLIIAQASYRHSNPKQTNSAPSQLSQKPNQWHQKYQSAHKQATNSNNQSILANWRNIESSSNTSWVSYTKDWKIKRVSDFKKNEIRITTEFPTDFVRLDLKQAYAITRNELFNILNI